MKKLAIIYSKYTPTIDVIKNYLQDVEVDVFEDVPANIKEYDLSAGVGVEDNFADINVHHSLLPSFSGEEPVKEAFLAGVKVTGITFYTTNPKRIVAQYPLFISNASHYDDVELEMQYLEQSLYPVVLDKILKNEAFEINNLTHSSSSGCGGCSKCSH